MIAYNWKAILDGNATQMRQLVKPGEWLMVHPYSDAYTSVHYNSVDMDSDTYNRITIGEYPDAPGRELTPDEEGIHRIVYQVGKTYAVQPGRRQKAVARIRILGIRREDVRDISDADVQAEGFESWMSFMLTWTKMHDPKFCQEWWRDELSVTPRYLKSQRPAARYDAWALTFEVVK